jgi:parvulin-like peptidyl-prolyl isomerase
MHRENNCARWLLAVLGMSALFSGGGCGEKSPTLTDAELKQIAITEKIQTVEKAGGLVLVVGGDTITSDEVLNASAGRYGEAKTVVELLRPIAKDNDPNRFRELARGRLKDVVLGRISGVLLYQHAKREIGENANEALDNMTEKELRKFVLRYGGDEAKADEALRAMGMDRKKFKDEQKKLIITQSYVASKLSYQRPVTYGEIVEYYEKHKDEFFPREAKLKFRLIDIDILKVPVKSLDENRAEAARKLGEELAKRARAGEDFAKLAEEYSHGHRRAFGGLWPEVQPDSLVEPYTALAEMATQINPGEIAGPAEAVGHIFVMKLEEKQDKGYEPLEKVQGQVNERILTDRHNEAVSRLNDRLRREAAIGETDEFIDFCLDKIYAMSREVKEPAAQTK